MNETLWDMRGGKSNSDLHWVASQHPVFDYSCITMHLPEFYTFFPTQFKNKCRSLHKKQQTGTYSSSAWPSFRLTHLQRENFREY